MYCNSCGKEIVNDARFCTHCGSTVGGGRRTMMRSRTNRKIAGVCAGLAHYLDIDIALVRVLTVLVTLALGVAPGVIAYIVAWIIVPQEPAAYPVPAGHPVTG